MRRVPLIGVLALATMAGAPAPAGAVIGPVTRLDGPSADIIELGGVAMAEDGTGGLVYRKRVDGRARVFAARFVDGAWTQPQRVDVGQRFDSTWPAIAAGNGGRLLVTWVHEFGVGTDRMFSATLDPGASRFQAPFVVDASIGEATYTQPQLAMNRGGQALLVYRVVTDDRPSASLPQGYVRQTLRLARYDGSAWNLAGNSLNRNPAQAVRTPVADNAPAVAIDPTGSGLVAWQEPGDDFVDRIWARRIFGGSTTVPLLVSNEKIGETPLRAGADAPDVDIAGIGEGIVAYRQQPPPDGREFSRARIEANITPLASDERAKGFLGARIMGIDAEAGPLGRPSAAVAPSGAFSVVAGAGGTTLEARGNEASVRRPARLDDGRSTSPGDPVADRSALGAVVAAWRFGTTTSAAVSVLERQADGTPLTDLLSVDTGGVVGPLELAGSGAGDAALAWLQGTGSGTALAAGFVDAPAETFEITTPADWTRARRIPVSWSRAVSAISPVTYSVLVDDVEVASGLTGTSYELTRRDVANGSQEVSVLATDSAGQETDSIASTLLVDRVAPRLSVRVDRRTRKVTVRATDSESGPEFGATRVSFGSATRRSGTRRVAYRLGRRGAIRVIASSRDQAGNRTSRSWRVRL